MIYNVVIKKGEDFGYIISCPALPGCHSQGDTIEEALENIKDAIRGWLEVNEGKIGNEYIIYEVSI